eukprot:5763533-Alexandrium_andersonii.AAC.1
MFGPAVVETLETPPALPRRFRVPEPQGLENSWTQAASQRNPRPREFQTVGFGRAETTGNKGAR